MYVNVDLAEIIIIRSDGDRFLIVPSPTILFLFLLRPFLINMGINSY